MCKPGKPANQQTSKPANKLLAKSGKQPATQKNIHNIIPVCTHETKTKHNNHLDKHCDYKKLLLLLLLLNK